MKRALFVVFKKYNTILEGGGIANERNIAMARRILGEDNVTVIYIHDESRKRSLWNLALSALCFPFGYFNGLLPWKVKSIVATAKAYDYVFISTSIFGILAKALKESGYGGTVIAHLHNIESIYYDSLLSKRLPGRSLVIGCAEKNDGYCCKYADKVLTLNTRDSDILSRLYGRRADVILPIAMSDRCGKITFDKEERISKRPVCLFLGSYFTANNEGITWFVKNVLPHVDIELRIVGKGMAKLKDYDSCFRDIPIVSDVPDLTPYYMSADFMILPIFSGSGMKVKTCEALMFGKNILGTDEAFEGYDIDTDRVGARCNTAEEFIHSIQQLTEKAIPRFNSYSRCIYEQQYSEDASVKRFEKIFCS